MKLERKWKYIWITKQARNNTKIESKYNGIEKNLERRENLGKEKNRSKRESIYKKTEIRYNL